MKTLGRIFITIGGIFLLATFALVARDSFGWSPRVPVSTSLFDVQLLLGLSGVALVQMGRAAMRAKNDSLLISQSRKQRRKEVKNDYPYTSS